MYTINGKKYASYQEVEEAARQCPAIMQQKFPFLSLEEIVFLTGPTNNGENHGPQNL